jgi:ferrous iron transport protein B
VLLAIVDASNLERNLYLTTQLLEVGVPVVVALNMVDVAEGEGKRIDAARLSRRLGVPVVPIRANRKVGLDTLKQTLADAAGGLAPVSRPIFPPAFEAEVTALRQTLGAELTPFLARRLLLDVGGQAEERLAAGSETNLSAARTRLADAGCAVPEVEARVRYGWLRDRLNGCVARPEKRPVTWTDRIDKVLTHRVWGTLIFAALMFVVFQAIFWWAKWPMDLIKEGQTLIKGLVTGSLPAGPLTNLLSDGLVVGVGSVLVFLPQILILFCFIAVLEDCGYMARAAYLMDRLMARSGLSGKSFIPLLSSVACAVPGILATRTIENRRDRLATILVAPLMSCSARLPMYGVVILAFFTEGYPLWVPGLVLFGMYLLGIVVAPVVALLLKGTLLKGKTPTFVMEMPTYKLPSVGSVLRRMVESSWEFIRRAGTVIFAAMIVVWALLYFPNGQHYDAEVTTLREQAEQLRNEGKGDEADRKEQAANDLYGEWRRQSILGQTGRAIEPVVKPLGWDWKIGTAVLASFPAREVVVGTMGILYDLGELDPEEDRAKLADKLKDFPLRTGLSLMVFFALCCQCASTLAVIKRETNSWRWPVFTFVYMTVLAYVMAFVVYQVGGWFS